MPNIFLPRRLTGALATVATAAAVGALAACNDANPAEVRTSASSFPQIASWSATANPVGTSTVRATLAIKQFLGFRMTSAMTITGAPNTTYQWRIFREGCASNTAALSNTSATGLLLFETTQSYPDVTTNAAGTGTVSPAIAGSLDSLTAYSVRVRPGQTSATWNGTNPISCGDLKRTAGG